MANPTRTCDLVLKGGITSGIVYPRAVCELAEEFRFVNIGGASAGAIAAAFTAAAEYQRQKSGAATGFDGLREMPAKLGETVNGRSRLLGLFCATGEAQRLFDVGLRWLETQKIIATLAALLGRFPRAAGAVAAIGVVAIATLIWAAVETAGPLRAFLLFAALVTVLATLLIAILGAVAEAIALALRVLPANGFGLCSGLAGLTPWLDERINALAGFAEGADPLTLRDLRSAGIELQMMTTNLTQRRPYTLPFETRVFHFAPSEFRKLFPGPVVDFLIKHARPSTKKRFTPDGEELHQLPEADDMPVVVLARMSLSFPLLLSAVPLHAVDYGCRGKKTAERCWFSDGGITSNFPVHFFDAPLPSRPTFAINLAERSARYHKEGQRIYLPARNHSGILEWWTPFTSVIGFLASIVNTMHGWRDNMLLRVPGYRDRIAHVLLEEHEGGLNLTMDAAQIEDVAAKGEEAAANLRARFSDDPPAGETLTWTNHRWVRFLTFMTALEQSLSTFGAHVPADLLDGATPLPSYKVSRTLLARFAQTTSDFAMHVADDFAGAPFESSPKIPRPRPLLGLRPRM